MYLPVLLKGLAFVTENGVLFKRQSYSSSFAIRSVWYEKAKLSGGWLIEVLYNPFNPNPIYYSDSESSNWVTFNTVNLPQLLWKQDQEEIVYQIAVNGTMVDLKPFYREK